MDGRTVGVGVFERKFEFEPVGPDGVSEHLLGALDAVPHGVLVHAERASCRVRAAVHIQIGAQSAAQLGGGCIGTVEAA